MTDPKLREARIAEAKRRAEANIHNGRYDQNLASSLYDLIESDWRPEPEVDAVTLAAREWLKKYTSLAGAEHDNINAGLRDDHLGVRAFRAGHAHGQANCADTRRMDWLEGVMVEVYGDDGPSVRHGFYTHDNQPLRTKIDRAMGGGE